MAGNIPHPAIAPGRGAVISGAADGIGRAVAFRCAAAGMKVALIDTSDRLDATAAEVRAAGAAEVLAERADVSDAAAVNGVRDTIFDRFGDVGMLMNNAGVGGGGSPLTNAEGWSRVLGVNLFGVINGVQAFGQRMVDCGRPGVIVNTGSKQGITCPPGDVAYNVSKAGIRTLTEGLAHSLRQIEGCRVSAHLLIPGFTYTGMMRRHFPEKPPAAWTSEQVADEMFTGLAAGDFYLWCADNETPRSLDEKRVLWMAGDIVESRPALSRWHPDYKAQFEAYCKD